MKWCTKCIYPASSAVKLSFDENGVCSGCIVNAEKPKIDWDERAKMLQDLVEPYRSKTGGYDILIPVSGGKDSTVVIYLMKKLGYDVEVIIEIRISKGKLIEVEKEIANHPNIFAVYDVTGDFDAVIIARFKNRKSMDYFLKKIQTYDFIERTFTKFILHTIKEEPLRID